MYTEKHLIELFNDHDYIQVILHSVLYKKQNLTGYIQYYKKNGGTDTKAMGQTEPDFLSDPMSDRKKKSSPTLHNIYKKTAWCTTFTFWQFIEIFPFNQLEVYVFLVVLLWCWFITNMAAKGLVERLYRCLRLAKPKCYFQHPFSFISRLSRWAWKVSPHLSAFSALIFINNSKSRTVATLRICEVGNTTTYAVGAFHHWYCGFDSRSGRGAQHYVITFVNDLRQVGGIFRILRFPPPIKLTARI
jgi:hypothetical protein